MKICGLQKLTLVDYPGKMAAIIFTGGCNFRCPFCHNSALVTDVNNQEEIEEEEVLAFLEKRKNLLEGVVVTGGEPLIHSDIIPLLKKIKELGYLIKLDTNGTFPNLLEEIIDLGLCDYVAMDIKNSLKNYGKTIGFETYDTSKIEKSINLLKKGKVSYEFRTTVVKNIHFEEDFLEIAKMISPESNYFLQTFVPSQNTIVQGLSAPSDEEMKNYLKLLKTYIKSVSIRDK